MPAKTVELTQEKEERKSLTTLPRLSGGLAPRG